MVFINTSSTAIKVLEFITAKNITVVTNNGSVLAFDLDAMPWLSDARVDDAGAVQTLTGRYDAAPARGIHLA